MSKWLVVEKMRKMGWSVNTVYMSNGQHAVWFHKRDLAGPLVRQLGDPKHAKCGLGADMAPDTICRAALAAVEDK